MFSKLTYRYILFLVLLISLNSSCDKQPEISAEYIAEMQAWDAKRVENLKRENGWLSLVGLYWLEEGGNTFGADKSNKIVFPENSCDPFLGKITLSKGQVFIDVRAGVEILHDSTAITAMQMMTDNDESTTVLAHRSLRWYIIKRGDMFGIRLRDINSRLRTEFAGIDRFPLDGAWQIKAKFVRYDPPKAVEVPNVIGTISEEMCYGAFEFSLDGKIYRVEPSGSPEDKSMFLVFGDLTNRIETYGGGRFLSIPAPDSTGYSVIDFNKAYNPPCVFTPYATCPLPTDSNKLEVRVTAGEKMWSIAHH